MTAVGGALAATAVVGTQVADHRLGEVARASADRGSSTDNRAEDGRSSQSPAESDRGAGTTVSRSSNRPSLDDLKRQEAEGERTTAKDSGSRVVTKKAEAEVSDPRELARAMLSEYGWGQEQFACLDQLWIGESNWKVAATNPTSGAYGIPQALPAGKMASAGSDWRTNPATQIEWGLGYIQQSYGTPCAAESFKSGHNWY